MTDHGVCNVHEQEVSAITEIRTDIKWLKKFGFIWLTVVGGAIVLLVPLMITFFVYLSRLDGRVANSEWRIGKIEKKLGIQ